MAKPPFKYKPTQIEPQPQQIEFSGASEVLATYSDVFAILTEPETGVASLYFYQRHFDDRKATIGHKKSTLAAAFAKCVSRIVMSEKGVDKLLEALAQNRGFDLVRKSDVEEVQG